VALRVVGAGLGRTATSSLKLALEELLGGACYHMSEAIERPQDTAVWHAAVRGEPVDWSAFPAAVEATVDWPACAFWRELADANPAAVVLLSTRSSAGVWWESFDQTIGSAMRRPVPGDDPNWQERRAMVLDILGRFSADFADRQTTIAAYDRHNAAVRAEVPAGRLIDWRAGDGWEPLCQGLGVPIPTEPFPHVNTGAEFRAQARLDADT
jgi:Sulfotransferase domain